MAGYIYLALRAEDHARNIRRSWIAQAQVDLLGTWIVTITFGRIGSRGREMRYPCASEAAAQALVRKGLRRRHSAVRRLGVAYRVIEASADGLSLAERIGMIRKLAA